jgi:prevent-host-death family protein
MTICLVPVRELNQNTSAVLARVQAGEEMLITVSGRAVARLVPVEAGRTFLDQMVAEGRAVPAADDSPFPVPVDLGGPDVNVGDLMIADRELERW